MISKDLTGQVNADSIGTRMYSGFGGQVDFIRGAAEGFDGWYLDNFYRFA